MVNGINNNLGSSIAASNNKASESKATKAADNGNEQTRSANSVKDDAVTLTESAASLQKLEAKIADMPDVDMAKVDRIKQQLADGSFEVNADSTAAKILDSVRELAGS